jgi:hypothetical protein
MQKFARLVFLLLPFGAFMPTSGFAAVQTDDFLVTTTAQLLNLCTAAQTDPMAVPALNFCHGFAVGVARVLQEEDAANPNAKAMFCLPPSGVDRNHALSEFVQWASADPSRMSLPATDGIAEFLAAYYPCSH